MAADFSPENKENRGKWHVFQVLRNKTADPKSYMPQKFSFGNEGAIKTFLDEGIQKQHYQKIYPRRKTIKVSEKERKC